MKYAILRFLDWIVKGTPVVKITANISQISPNRILVGKNIVVTGGGRGIGFYIAKKCIEEGANVLITGRNIDTLKNASVELDNCKYEQFDVQEIGMAEVLFRKAETLLGGKINCLINNAGISLHEPTVLDVTEDTYDKQFDTNLKGPYFLSQAFIRYIEKNHIPNTNILFITSERGMYCDTIPYGLTKAAINSLTAGLARRYITEGIRVNAIAPGVTASDMTGFDKNSNLYREQSCGKRIFLPEEIAEITAFVLSDASNCITGEIFPCNQGNHLRSDY